MSSIYRKKWEFEAEMEMQELEEKRAVYGWTKEDAERYEHLKKELRLD